MTTNGRIPDDQLTTVAVGVELLTPVANALRALILQAAHEHVSIRVASGVGSGYRDLETQTLFYRAWQGDKAARRAVSYNTSSTVKVAAPGSSSHGWGDRIDLLFDGSQNPDSVDLNLARRFGFSREFGSRDANHFKHDGKTAIRPTSEAPAKAPAAEHGFYVVREDDTLSEIAEDHHLSLARVRELNPGITNPDRIFPGQQVRIR